MGELQPRPSTIANVVDVEVFERVMTTIGRRIRMLGEAVGSQRTGLRHCEVLPGMLSMPPHCHSLEEEIFVVLEGEGTLELHPSPQRVRAGVAYEEQPIRAGSVISRPAGTGISHGLRAGEPGLTFLAYGTRRPDDVCYYPRSNKIYFRGLGLIARLEDLDYDDGEPR